MRMLSENEDAWVDAVQASTLKPRLECVIADYVPMVQEVGHILKNCRTWAEPVDVATPISLVPASSREEAQPLGATLVIGPSNYSLSLSLTPLVGAIAAGCPVVLKPSELCPEVSALLAALVPAYLDTDCFAVVQGGVACTSSLLELKWANILFTGSERVGRIVASAAAAHLTPVTLELGGKSPVIVDGAHPVDMRDLAKKLVFGRLLIYI